ncbi:Naphthalene 1,2-dioxygenase/salicylate 5-hydroxylase systems, ferredoxin component [Zhongshania aliphaticivorans]|uniref:Naphthalene 1,2-dioxygenase/salicylate 5-hydroxylase systems, ferredoxin component n=1 Tax=Zhongshania aliphaticivorans TaxID=1470434 RepID=A0A5S9P4A5_9GAMM|nr:Rieske (2Fe-2S) protein [Zhongshania aliphaticivorans]CAA0090574.1 Naphthalene 1,2-dioxygenase/salicylate 5-hydroxylase systems, ferredoxin component [Zhongshania aliphaticivorans]CAA0098065.1 Naphthalene 1,2-dioxygenase/salicylate 5-hydroxylase systems, ferredoxin component [Zhongshania aliphaticivorans]
MDKIFAANLDEIQSDALLSKTINGNKVLFAKVNGQICAVENRCPHLGLPLAKGKICDGAVVCPFHGSSFDLLDGRNIDWTNAFIGMPMPGWTHKLIALGKSPQSLKTFKVECEDEKVFLIL